MNRLFLTAILACGCIELISSNQSISITGNLAFAESSQQILQTPSNSHLLHPTAVTEEEESDEQFNDATVALREPVSPVIPSPVIPAFDDSWSDRFLRDSKSTSSAVEEEKKPSEAAAIRTDWVQELKKIHPNTSFSVLEGEEDQRKADDTNFNFS